MKLSNIFYRNYSVILMMELSQLRKIYYFLLFFVLFINIYAHAKKVYHPTFLSDSPKIDGYIDDPVWQNVPADSSFIQREPMDGGSPSLNTFFKIGYDKKNIYVAIMAFDPDPSKIKNNVSKRDHLRNVDRAGVLLDTYFDRRTAFEFSVSAAGVQLDAVWTNDNVFNRNWNAVWKSEVKILSNGWSAELKIPFSQLRFGKKKKYIWGLQVYRYIDRFKEFDVWQYFPKDTVGFVSNFGTLNSLQNITPPKRIELIPYIVGEALFEEPEARNPFKTGHEFKSNQGFDAKIGIAGNFTLDLTFLPDFGQVEADPSELNLTAFETHFEEKRPFFIEGSSILSFPLRPGGNNQGENVLYSRRIGGTPSRDPELNDGEYGDVPSEVSILTAAKLTGKTNNNLSVGLLYALTQEEKAKIKSDSISRTEIVEPWTHFGLLRLKKEFRNGQSSIGMITTGVVRDIPDSNFFFLPTKEIVGGIDFYHQFWNKTFYIDGKAVMSKVEGHKEALLDIQTSSAHYFQRPDIKHVHLDSNRTALTGHGGMISFGKAGNGRYKFSNIFLWRSPGFEINEMGYLRQADQMNHIFWNEYQVFEPTRWYNNYELTGVFYNGFNFDGINIFRGAQIRGKIEFPNFSGAGTGVKYEWPSLGPNLLRGGPLMRYEGKWEYSLSYYTDRRKNIQSRIELKYEKNRDGISFKKILEWKNFFQISSQLSFRVVPKYYFEVNDLQYLDALETNNNTRYIMARLKRKTFSTTFRLNYNITPHLTLELYAQPYITSGVYSHYKYITNPRASKYHDRFQEYAPEQLHTIDNESITVDENLDGVVDYELSYPDFNFRQLRANLVLRWEFLPGSILYFVYSHEQTSETHQGLFRPLYDFRELITSNPTSIFLLKVSYWWGLS